MKQIRIGGKTYNVLVASTDEEREEGLSQETYLPLDSGMLFIYSEPQEEIGYTMEDTGIPLDIIFINEECEVISVHTMKPYSETPIFEKNVMYVLEVNPCSGIEPGDFLELEFEEDKEAEEKVKSSKLLVLNSDGDVQMQLNGGERIFSRVSTRKLIACALHAYKSDQEKDYKRLGRAVIKEIEAQDARPPQYVDE